MKSTDFAVVDEDGKSSDQSNVEDQTSAAEEHSYACQDVDSRVLTELTPVAVSADADVTKNTELGVMEQLMMNVPQLVSSEVCRTDGANLVYQVPEYLPIDLRAKLVVCLIYEGRQIAAEVKRYAKDVCFMLICSGLVSVDYRSCTYVCWVVAGCIFLSLCLSVCSSACVCVCVCVCACLSVFLSFCLSVHPSACLSICLSVCPSVRLSVCIYVCLYVYMSVCLSNTCI